MAICVQSDILENRQYLRDSVCSLSRNQCLKCPKYICIYIHIFRQVSKISMLVLCEHNKLLCEVQNDLFSYLSACCPVSKPEPEARAMKENGKGIPLEIYFSSIRVSEISTPFHTHALKKLNIDPFYCGVNCDAVWLVFLCELQCTINCECVWNLKQNNVVNEED